MKEGRDINLLKENEHLKGKNVWKSYIRKIKFQEPFKVLSIRKYIK